VLICPAQVVLVRPAQVVLVRPAQVVSIFPPQRLVLLVRLAGWRVIADAARWLSRLSWRGALTAR
jgi:hypothetical protein